MWLCQGRNQEEAGGANTPQNFTLPPPQIISVESHLKKKLMHFVPKYVTLPPQKKIVFAPRNKMSSGSQL